jgi:proline iminopeptidase
MEINGGELAVFSLGRGEPVIFLHGGPGDTHHYMKRMAEPLFSESSKPSFQCIFFDQRGTGASKLNRRSRDSFLPELLFDDLDRVRRKFTRGPIRLVGHSWGAMYGLYACMHAPEMYSHAALLNMGPLDSEMERLSGEALLKAMGTSDHLTWSTLRARRNAARENADIETVEACDREMMSLRVKSWIFDSKLRESFLIDYFQDPPPDREVNKFIWEAQAGWFNWEDVSRATSKIWLLAGRHDATPLSQFDRLSDRLPNSRLTVYEKCGHIPWFERPELFYRDLSFALT